MADPALQRQRVQLLMKSALERPDCPQWVRVPSISARDETSAPPRLRPSSPMSKDRGLSVLALMSSEEEGNKIRTASQ
jgi:hypothetical protein